MENIIYESLDLNETMKNEMFEMYIKSYSSTGNLWFKTPRDMFKYPCEIIIDNGYQNNISYFIMYQKRTNVNKISLIVNDGSREGKDNLFFYLNELLNTKGWIIEASGAVSWIFRSKYNVPIIYNLNKIINLLDLNIENENIVLNPNFNINDKNSNVYTHQYYKDGIIQFQNPETLFGTEGCVFSSNTCNRSCLN